MIASFSYYMLNIFFTIGPLNMLDSTQQTILKQEKEIETLRTQILEKQTYIHSHIDLAIDLYVIFYFFATLYSLYNNTICRSV